MKIVIRENPLIVIYCQPAVTSKGFGGVTHRDEPCIYLDIGDEGGPEFRRHRLSANDLKGLEAGTGAAFKFITEAKS